MGFYSNGYRAPIPEVITAPATYHAIVLHRSFRDPRAQHSNLLAMCVCASKGWSQHCMPQAASRDCVGNHGPLAILVAIY
ncbi:hypothetical protein B296_00001413 [Ensete ventricosum]|uniref:Uncharacterized protein n=1 Tax=Ensete ventricosum TaxID=4639 RepID=A0A427AMT2_ENSVE|nr:hypothetical protein B296_00001413 [Ensete ventricosum]